MQIIVTIKNKNKKKQLLNQNEKSYNCVEAPRKKMRYIDSTYMAPTSWRVKDHKHNMCEMSTNRLCPEMPYLINLELKAAANSLVS